MSLPVALTLAFCYLALAPLAVLFVQRGMPKPRHRRPWTIPHPLSEFEQRLEDLGCRFAEVARAVGDAFVPVAQRMVDAFAAFGKAWDAAFTEPWTRPDPNPMPHMRLFRRRPHVGDTE